MGLNRDKIMNTYRKARKDATTDRAEPHYEPTFEQIQARAYEIYNQRDWFQAEKELKTMVTIIVG